MAADAPAKSTCLSWPPASCQRPLSMRGISSLGPIIARSGRIASEAMVRSNPHSCSYSFVLVVVVVDGALDGPRSRPPGNPRGELRLSPSPPQPPPALKTTGASVLLRLLHTSSRLSASTLNNSRRPLWCHHPTAHSSEIRLTAAMDVGIQYCLAASRLAWSSVLRSTYEPGACG